MLFPVEVDNFRRCGLGRGRSRCQAQRCLSVERANGNHMHAKVSLANGLTSSFGTPTSAFTFTSSQVTDSRSKQRHLITSLIVPLSGDWLPFIIVGHCDSSRSLVPRLQPEERTSLLGVVTHSHVGTRNSRIIAKRLSLGDGTYTNFKTKENRLG
jgi:hypothetical protein